MQHGDAAVRDLVASRVPLFRFAIRATIEKYDLDTTEGRLAAIDAAAPIIAGIRDRGMRDRYAIDLDKWTGFLDEQFVLRRVREHASRGRGEHRVGAVPRPPGTPRSRRRLLYDPSDPIVQRRARDPQARGAAARAARARASTPSPPRRSSSPATPPYAQLIAELGGTAAATGAGMGRPVA